MTHLEYLKQNAVSVTEFPDGRFTVYRLQDGFATYNNVTNTYLWYKNPQPGSAE